MGVVCYAAGTEEKVDSSRNSRRTRIF